MKIDNLASYIDHTLLKAVATKDDIKLLCQQAKDNKFATVCVNSGYVSLAASLLVGSNVKVCTVTGFPLGANSTAIKAFEASQSVLGGAREIDMVINIGALKSFDYDFVKEDILAVVKAAKNAVDDEVLVKVIIETCYLTNAEKEKACLLVKDCKADFVKTSTGFGSGGATLDDILLMRKVVGKNFGLKASGGISTREQALEMIKAGANRIGTSAGLKIVDSSAKLS